MFPIHMKCTSYPFIYGWDQYNLCLYYPYCICFSFYITFSFNLFSFCPFFFAFTLICLFTYFSLCYRLRLLNVSAPHHLYCYQQGYLNDTVVAMEDNHLAFSLEHFVRQAVVRVHLDHALAGSILMSKNLVNFHLKTNYHVIGRQLQNITFFPLAFITAAFNKVSLHVYLIIII